MREMAPPREDPVDEPGWGSLAWNTLRSRLWFIILGTCLGAGIAALATFAVPREYTTEVAIVIEPQVQGPSSETDIRTAAAMLRSEILAAAVAQQDSVRLPADEVLQRTAVERPPGSGLLLLTARHPDRSISTDLAEEMRSQFSSMVAGAGDREPVNMLTVRTVGPIVSRPGDRPIVRNTILGGVAGLLLASMVVAAREQRSPRVREVAQLAAMGAHVVACLPPPNSDRVVGVATMEALLTRPAVRNWSVNPQIILVLGPDHSYRAALSAALASAATLSGKEVLLVDLSLDGSSLAARCGRDGDEGLQELLSGGEAEAAYIGDERLSQVLGRAYGPVSAGVALLPRGKAGLLESGVSLSNAEHTLRTLAQDYVLLLDGRLDPAGTDVDLTELGIRVADAVVLAPVRDRTTARSISDAINRVRTLTAAPVVTFLLGSSRAHLYLAQPGRTPIRQNGSTAAPPTGSGALNASAINDPAAAG